VKIVDFAVWTLFTKTFRHLRGHWKKVPHLLCHGSERCTTNGIDGIVAHYPNQNVAALKDSPWTEVLNLLGSKGDGIMLSLLLDCGVFVPVESGRGNLCQLSGINRNAVFGPVMC
jgi:telomerase reverse transcriptase